MMIDLCNATTPNQEKLCRNMDTLHIPMYPRQMTPHLLAIDLYNATTPNQENLYSNPDTVDIPMYPRQMFPPINQP